MTPFYAGDRYATLDGRIARVFCVPRPGFITLTWVDAVNETVTVTRGFFELFFTRL